MKKPVRSPWPKGARCAVMISDDFDAESGWLSRGPQGTYAAKVGVWWATGQEIAAHWIERETGRRPQ